MVNMAWSRNVYFIVCSDDVPDLVSRFFALFIACRYYSIWSTTWLSGAGTSRMCTSPGLWRELTAGPTTCCWEASSHSPSPALTDTRKPTSKRNSTFGDSPTPKRRRPSWPWSAKKLRTCLLMQAQRKLGPISVMLCKTQPSSLLGIHRENTRIGSTATTRRLSPYWSRSRKLMQAGLTTKAQLPNMPASSTSGTNASLFCGAWRTSGGRIKRLNCNSTQTKITTRSSSLAWRLCMAPLRTLMHLFDPLMAHCSLRRAT